MIELFDPGDLPDAVARRCPVEAAYIRQFAETSSQDLIRNVSTTVRALSVGDTLMPVTVDSPVRGNCYVVSPSAAYTDYAEYELQVVPSAIARAALKATIAVFGRWVGRVRLDRVVHVNNWMVSTNLYLGWEAGQLEEISVVVREQYPESAIAFRSLNTFSNGALIQQAVRGGFLLLPSRQIYIQDARQDGGSRFRARRDLKQDARLFAHSGYAVSRPDPDRGPEVFDRLERLYNLLYLEKYTPLNPRFTSRWMRNGCRDGWLDLTCLVTGDGRIDGVAGCLRRGDTMTTPVLGYDTALPQSLGLYRMLSWICTDKAIRDGLALNCSGGAASFKRSRGALPVIEYSAVYVKHLDSERKLAWRVLAGMLNRLAAPLLRRYAL